MYSFVSTAPTINTRSDGHCGYLLTLKNIQRHFEIKHNRRDDVHLFQELFSQSPTSTTPDILDFTLPVNLQFPVLMGTHLENYTEGQACINCRYFRDQSLDKAPLFPERLYRLLSYCRGRFYQRVNGSIGVPHGLRNKRRNWT